MSAPLELLRRLEKLHQEELQQCQDVLLTIRTVVREASLHSVVPEQLEVVRRRLGCVHPRLSRLLEPEYVYAWLEAERSDWARELYIRLSGADAARPLVIPAAPDTYIEWEIESGVGFEQTCRDGLQDYCRDLKRAAEAACKRCEARQRILLQAPSLT